MYKALFSVWDEIDAGCTLKSTAALFTLLKFRELVAPLEHLIERACPQSIFVGRTVSVSTVNPGNFTVEGLHILISNGPKWSTVVFT